MTKKRTTLTFYGGVNEIGGNKILLEDGDTRVFLDFGMSFGKRGLYYEEFLNPRSANGIGDFLEMNLVPNIEGLYREDLLKTAGLKTREPNIDGVFLTHAHADHSNYISFLHEKIPIYVGETAYLILNAIAESGTRDIESEIIDFKKRPLIDRKVQPLKRVFKCFRTRDKIKIGSLEIEPIHVDHSVPGAYGFIVHTSRGAVIYTGDLRMHGTKPEMTRDFIEHAKETKPTALIIEGTRIDEEHDPRTENDVKDECEGYISKTNRIVIADFNFKDVDRFKTFFEIAKNQNRKLVVSLKDAFLLKWLSQDMKLNVSPPTDENLAIYIPKRGTGRYIESDYNKRERQFLNLENAWTAKEVKKKQNHIILVLSFFGMSELIDVKPDAIGLFIHSLSEPFNEEMEIDYRRLRNWLLHFQLQMIQSHCSGHVCRKELIDIATTISPKVIFPIHTEHSHLFRELFKNMHVKLALEGKPIEIA